MSDDQLYYAPQMFEEPEDWVEWTTERMRRGRGKFPNEGALSRRVVTLRAPRWAQGLAIRAALEGTSGTNEARELRAKLRQGVPVSILPWGSPERFPTDALVPCIRRLGEDNYAFGFPPNGRVFNAPDDWSAWGKAIRLYQRARLAFITISLGQAMGVAEHTIKEWTDRYVLSPTVPLDLVAAKAAEAFASWWQQDWMGTRIHPMHFSFVQARWQRQESGERELRSREDNIIVREQIPGLSLVDGGTYCFAVDAPPDCIVLLYLMALQDRGETPLEMLDAEAQAVFAPEGWTKAEAGYVWDWGQLVGDTLYARDMPQFQVQFYESAGTSRHVFARERYYCFPLVPPVEYRVRGIEGIPPYIRGFGPYCLVGDFRDKSDVQQRPLREVEAAWVAYLAQDVLMEGTLNSCRDPLRPDWEAMPSPDPPRPDWWDTPAGKVIRPFRGMGNGDLSNMSVALAWAYGEGVIDGSLTTLEAVAQGQVKVRGIGPVRSRALRVIIGLEEGPAREPAEKALAVPGDPFDELLAIYDI